ncbi:MAG: RND family transporter [Planctomycetota bacterium]
MSRRRAGIWITLHVALVALALFPVLTLRSDVSPHVFLSPADPVRASHERFTDHFGADAFLVVTCRGDGSDGFRARVTELAGALRRAAGVDDVQFPEPRAPLTRELALSDASGRRLSLLVLLRSASRSTVSGVERLAGDFPDLDPALAGQLVLNRALQEASANVGRRLFPLLALAMALLLWLAYRSVRVVAVVFATTACVLLLGMAVVALADRPVNLITILLPVLLLALTVALCIHLVNAFRLHRAGGRPVAEAIRATRRDELRPCLVTSLTTAAGFGSFALSRVDPLRVLGVAMAVSILLAFAVAFTLLPALLRLLAPRPREGLDLGARLVRWVPRLVARPRAVLLLALLVVAAGLQAAPRVPRETNGLRYLPASHPLRMETEHLQAEGVGTASLELVLQAAAGGSLLDLAAPLRRLERSLRTIGGPVHGVLTPLSLARQAAFQLGLPADEGLEAMVLGRTGGAAERYLRTFRDVDAGLARVSLRIDPIDVETYRDLRDRVLALAGAALRDTPGARGDVTGEYPIIMTVQSELLHTLLASLAGTALTILLVLSVAQRSVRQALLTLLPAALPLAFVVLACALAGVPLSISTVMVMAVTLGIVTDDSVHMQHALAQGRPLSDALRRVGAAVTETSIAIFLGFAVLGGADFLPTRQFGLLTAGAMIVALAADLVVFPVLLGRARAGVDRRSAASPPSLAPREVGS